MVWNFVIQLVIALVISAISYALAPRSKTSPPKAASIDEFQVPTAEEGRTIPRVWGTFLVSSPNCLDRANLRTEPIRESAG